MWAILKFEKNNLSLLKDDLNKKLGQNTKIYIPKLRIQKFQNKKLKSKEINLLGDYMFFFHKNLKEKKIINSLRYTRGLKYFLNGFNQSQKEIEKFIEKCKVSENQDGFLSKEFFELELNKKYKFSSGPFSDKIFQIINLQRNRIKVLIGNMKTTIKRKEFLFTPV
tara:strand:- start:191 stop:688 length:498 start_codon:yes stop_codon:yes gene_type:complete